MPFPRVFVNDFLSQWTLGPGVTMAACLRLHHHCFIRSGKASFCLALLRSTAEAKATEAQHQATNHKNPIA